jgi:2-keto-4-pentenoate hydratase/2-oxohepta-3-ene-1,7-dioic acid hydratase in catechol pathway
MKLLNFEAEGNNHFGFVTGSYVVSFKSLQPEAEQESLTLDSVDNYLEQLPGSFNLASEISEKASSLIESGKTEQFYSLDQVRIRPPLMRPTALLDFGLTPKHLKNSAMTLLKHQLGPVLGRVIGYILGKRVQKMSRSDTPPYYKGNHLVVIGDNDTIGWPDFTSYLDIEPELAIVVGSEDCRIAGYTIFNDASARDVQFPEMIGTGPARSKDFYNSNGLGPFLVTPDELPDPLNLEVEIRIGDRDIWRGHTSEYTLHPEKVVDYLDSFFGIQPGTVIGMGTIPDCTGLDRDTWLLPGDIIYIEFEKLGILRQNFPKALPALKPSKWSQRSELLQFQAHRRI